MVEWLSSSIFSLTTYLLTALCCFWFGYRTGYKSATKFIIDLIGSEYLPQLKEKINNILSKKYHGKND